MANSKISNEKHPKRGQFTARLADQQRLAGKHRAIWLELDGPETSCFADAKAGQFVQLACRDLAEPRCTSPLLRRPFSIAGIDRSESGLVRIELIYRIIGPGTGWLADSPIGRKIDMLGPLGNGFTLPAEKDATKCLLVGGGVGLPPMFFLAQQLAEAGYNDVIGFAGARSGDMFACGLELDSYDPAEPLKPQMPIDRFAASRTASIVATDDGTLGFAGSVSAAIEQFLNERPEWLTNCHIYTCGPDGMLRAIAKLAERSAVPSQVCMEGYMSCGIGLCQSCAVARRSSANNDDQTKYKLVCTNGPVFDAQDIMWE